MRIQVITDDGGKILGTMQAIEGFEARLIPLHGQNVYELDLPDGAQRGQDSDQHVSSDCRLHGSS